MAVLAEIQQWNVAFKHQVSRINQSGGFNEEVACIHDSVRGADFAASRPSANSAFNKRSTTV
jgi:hypothetical protein